MGYRFELIWLNSSTDNKLPLSIENLYIVDGEGATIFMKNSMLNNTKPFCKVSNMNLNLYNIQNSIVIVSEEMNLNNIGMGVEVVKPWLEISKNVVTLTLNFCTSYKGNSSEISEETFIKGLNSRVEGIEVLEEPNFITGISAGAASWRLYNNLSFEMYAIYLCSSHLDSSTVRPILNLMECLKLPVQIYRTNLNIEDNILYM